MTRFVRLSVLAVASAALVACGGGAKLGGGKEGAAQAFFEASQPAGNQSRQGNAIQNLINRAVFGASETVSCAHGGSVTLSLDLSSLDDLDGTSGSFAFNLEYDDCNEDGVNEYDGKMKMLFDFATDGTNSAAIALRFKGKIDINGEIDDFIDVDVSQTVSLEGLGTTTGSVTVKLDGTIKTSEESYTYVNESITLTVGGQLPAAADGNS